MDGDFVPFPRKKLPPVVAAIVDVQPGVGDGDVAAAPAGL